MPAQDRDPFRIALVREGVTGSDVCFRPKAAIADVRYSASEPAALARCQTIRPPAPTVAQGLSVGSFAAFSAMDSCFAALYAAAREIPRCCATISMAHRTSRRPDACSSDSNRRRSCGLRVRAVTPRCTANASILALSASAPAGSRLSRCAGSTSTNCASMLVSPWKTLTSTLRHRAAMYRPRLTLMPTDVLFTCRPSLVELLTEGEP